ncbi:hypothetical protein L2K70_16585 [Nocardioides KLBMP 9356]|uniref:Uncharacterized protein n=1 Tax=Nocardioides potassii TaxID=2911371 RepID=A0ABS9HDG5_9ACTN|nr:hypothetical protein [Nocardioides potassii]MCF6379230.1 hypothetical protein [Nocardioides potassii]
MTTSDDEQDALAAEERESTPNASGPAGAAGGSGSSSEWVGHAGPGQVGADGTRDTSVVDTPDDAPPEQSEGGVEPNPDDVEPKAGYPSLHPQHDDKPY